MNIDQKLEDPLKLRLDQAGATNGDPAERKLSITESLQKIYLSVGKVISPEEARELINQEHGTNLSGDFQPASQGI